MIPTDPNTAVATLSHLYSTGAFFCLGIVAVYLALKYASTHVAWLEVPGRAHYVTVALAVIAVFALPATQGTTPNTSMIGSAAATLLALLLPGAPSSSKAPQAGSISFTISYVLAAIAGLALAVALMLHLVGCATLKADAIVAGKSFAACGEKDASGLFAQVGAIVANNDGNLEAELTSLAATAGVDAVKCAIAAIDAALSPPSGSGATMAIDVTVDTGTGAVTSKPTGLARAKAWAAKS